jgi:hypothetical protein
VENVKGMFSRKYGGVPAWIILLIAVGGAYLYMRHTGSSLFGGSSSSSTDPNADPGSATPSDGGTPSIVYVQQPPATSNPSNPNHPHHPAGPPPTHKVTTAQRAAAIMADFRKHGLAYFTNHPGALSWLKINAPGDYRVVHAAQTGKKVTNPHGTGARKNPPKQGGPARKTPKSPKVRG